MSHHCKCALSSRTELRYETTSTLSSLHCIKSSLGIACIDCVVQPRAGLDAVAVILNIPWKDATWGDAILNSLELFSFPFQRNPSIPLQSPAILFTGKLLAKTM